MQRTCAAAATESTVEIKTHGTVLTQQGSYTLWVCVRHATSLITTREKTLQQPLHLLQISLYKVRLTLRKLKSRALIIISRLSESAMVLIFLL